MKHLLTKAIMTLAVGSMVLGGVQGAEAITISTTDWHLTTDGFGGLKQAQLSEDVYFAVSKSTVFDPTATYEMLHGFHWASSDEYIALIGEIRSPKYAYFGQGGWNGYRWEGVTRYQFLFSDTLATDRIQLAGNWELSGFVRNLTSYHQSFGNNYFAGFVLVKDSNDSMNSVAPVPEPSTMLLLGSGLAGLALWRQKKNKAK